jgi:hypothetical protein
VTFTSRVSSPDFPIPTPDTGGEGQEYPSSLSDRSLAELAVTLALKLEAWLSNAFRRRCSQCHFLVFEDGGARIIIHTHETT